MPGKNCAVVGCPACKSRHRGLSFFQIKRPKYPEWERALVRAINRADAGFNVKRATICSRHFEDSCFVFRDDVYDGAGRTLIPGSLPTRFMPNTSRPLDQEPSAAKHPRSSSRAPPTRFVKYHSFAEVLEALESESLPPPWCLVSSTLHRVVLAAVDSDSGVVRLKANIKPDFSTSVYAVGLPVKGLAGSVETVPLKKYLQNLSALKLCPGVSDPELQDLAWLPTADPGQVYFRHVQYITSGSEVAHRSTVRSRSCVLLRATPDYSFCDECARTRALLQRKVEGLETSDVPPSCAAPEKLVDQVKAGFIRSLNLLQSPLNPENQFQQGSESEVQQGSNVS